MDWAHFALPNELKKYFHPVFTCGFCSFIPIEHDLYMHEFKILFHQLKALSKQCIQIKIKNFRREKWQMHIYYDYDNEKQELSFSTLSRVQTKRM